MTPIKFTDPTDSSEGEPLEIQIANLDGTWYSYIAQKWANAVTKDSNGNITGCTKLLRSSNGINE